MRGGQAVPECPRHKKGLCERSQPIILGEADGWWTFGCRNCKLVYVQTKEGHKEQAIDDLRRAGLRTATKDERRRFFPQHGRVPWQRERDVHGGMGTTPQRVKWFT